MLMLVRFFVAVSLVAGLAFANLDNNPFTYNGTPVPGQSFTITWIPSTYNKIDILLWSLGSFPYYVPTTSVPIASMFDFNMIYTSLTNDIQRKLKTRASSYGRCQQR